MFDNPLRKYQVGGSVATPSEEQQEMLAAFVEWLPTKVKEFANMQPEQIVDALNEISKTPDGQKQIQSLMEQFKKEISELSSSKFKKGGKLHDFICKHGKGAKIADCGCMDDGGEIKPLQKTPNNILVKLADLANNNYRPYVSEKPTQESKIVKIENLRQSPAMILIDPHSQPVQDEETMKNQWKQMERTPSKVLNPIQNLINRQYEEGGEIAKARGGYKVKNGSYEASVIAPGDTTRIKNYMYRTDTMQTYPDGTVRYHTTDNNGTNDYRWDLSKGRPSFWRRLLYGSKPATEFDKENWENIIANHPEDPRNILRNEEGGIIKGQKGVGKSASKLIGKAAKSQAKYLSNTKNLSKLADKSNFKFGDADIDKPFYGLADADLDKMYSRFKDLQYFKDNKIMTLPEYEEYSDLGYIFSNHPRFNPDPNIEIPKFDFSKTKFTKTDPFDIIDNSLNDIVGAAGFIGVPVTIGAGIISDERKRKKKREEKESKNKSEKKENGGIIKGQGGLSKIGKAVINTAKSARKTGTYVPEQAIGKPFFGNAVRFSKSISPERYRAVINWRLANDPNYKLSLDSMERAMQSMGNIDIAYDLYRLKNFGATNKAEFLQFEDMMNRGLTGNQVINSLKVRPGNNGISPLSLDSGHYAKEAEQMVFHPYVSGIGNFKHGGVVKGQEGLAGNVDVFGRIKPYSRQVSTTPIDSSKVSYNPSMRTVSFNDENGNKVSWTRNKNGTYRYHNGPDNMMFDPAQVDGYIPYNKIKAWGTAISGSHKLSDKHDKELQKLFEYAIKNNK